MADVIISNKEAILITEDGWYKSISKSISQNSDTLIEFIFDNEICLEYDPIYRLVTNFDVDTRYIIADNKIIKSSGLDYINLLGKFANSQVIRELNPKEKLLECALVEHKGTKYTIHFDNSNATWDNLHT